MSLSVSDITAWIDGLINILEYEKNFIKNDELNEIVDLVAQQANQLN